MTTTADEPAIQSQIELFLASMAGKSPATVRTYREALKRFVDFLDEAGFSRTHLACDLPGDILERFHGWLVDYYGRDH